MTLPLLCAPRYRQASGDPPSYTPPSAPLPLTRPLRYMEETLNPWWPKVDCSDLLAGGDAGKACYPAWYLDRMKKDTKVSAG